MITCCVVVFLLTPLIRKLALRHNIFDIPSNRKLHRHPVPLLGGAAIFAGLIAGFLFYPDSFLYFSPLIIGGGIILTIGLIDDIKGLSCKIRLVGQLAASLLIIYSGYRIEFLPDNIPGDIGEVVLTIIWIIGITNALNYLDGLDGLAAGITAISSLCFAVISYMTGQYMICTVSLMLMASCLGFIPHNFKRKKIFMGDAGSTLMGFVLACIAVMGHWTSDYVIRLSIPVLILGVPIFDMIFTTVMRIKGKKVSTVTEWLKYSGKDHFHHRLMDLGLSSIGSVLFINCVAIYLGISAVIISQAQEPLSTQAIIQGVLIFVVIGVLLVEGAKYRNVLIMNSSKAGNVNCPEQHVTSESSCHSYKTSIQ